MTNFSLEVLNILVLLCGVYCIRNTRGGGGGGGVSLSNVL